MHVKARKHETSRLAIAALVTAVLLAQSSCSGELREIMERADVSLSEKYRRLMEAYQIENEFGRTIEAYRGELDQEGDTRTVDFLRIGRVALLYQTLDAAETRVWGEEQKTWIDLGDDYRSPVRQGLRMARKQIAPDLLLVPIAAAEDAK